ncbi:MAG: hypothetical protein Q9163_005580 [Psora crenata]
MPGSNSTTTVSQLPANIIDAFIPGYGIVSRFLFDAFAMDITLLVFGCLMVFALVTAVNFIGKHAYIQIETYFMSSIRVERRDDLHDPIMDFFVSLNGSKGSRNLIARTNHEKPWDFATGGDDSLLNEQFNSLGLLNFSNWDAKTPPIFEPSYGKHWFFHQGRVFLFQRDQKPVMDSGCGGYTTMQNDEYIVITCLGRSNEPVKMLIKEARDLYLSRQRSCTTVRRPLPKGQRSMGGVGWMRAAVRPSRPMDTVVLDGELKDRVIRDINDYLHPAVHVWYSEKGIPYRRGYLLHGPPGTGKSSFAWALAGVFGLDIYCLSLVDPTLTEDEVGILFTTLPLRCIVLLEDIDSAGLGKRQEETDVAKTETEASNIGVEITRAFESVQKNNDKKDKKGISLSGLLNAIDGVASQEGRVLIMTTNFPENLDEALIRPGRIDSDVAFTYATRSQISELFCRMYSPVRRIPVTPAPAATMGAKPTGKLPMDGDATISKDMSPLKTLNLTPPASPHEAVTPVSSPTPPPCAEGEPTLEDIAAQFAGLLPDKTFTPAEIQGFLLTHKNEPVRALAKAVAWRDVLLAAKEGKKKKMEGKA